MENFDVIVVGAGPAGGHSARLLSKKGLRVLLVDRILDFKEKNFSSAGTILEVLEKFDLPESIVNSYWQQLKIISTHEEVNLRYKQRVGVILEFSKLRKFLAEQAHSFGCDLRLGHAYIKSEKISPRLTQVEVKDLKSGLTHQFSTRVLIDASGPARCVMGLKANTQYFWGFGQEWVVESEYSKIKSDELALFLGKKFAPSGYAWIFPNGENRWKVGCGSVSLDQKNTHHLNPYIEQLLAHSFAGKFSLVEKHGSYLKHAQGMNDHYFDADKNLFSVGDATSLCNPMGGEGIRHVLRGAEICTKHVMLHLEKALLSERRYKKELRKGIYWKWLFSEKYAVLSYLGKSDADWDKSLRRMKKLGSEELFALLFTYQIKLPRLIFKFLWSYCREIILPRKKLSVST